MSYTKTITPAFEQIGKRKRLTGYLAELHDGNILLYSCEFDTNSQAEKVLDGLVFELLTDLADQGLVDDVPAAMEAECVSSTHLPSWQGICSEPDNHCELHNPCPAHAADAARYLANENSRPARCATCGGQGYCPDCGTLFMAEPPADPLPTDGPGDPIPGDPGYEYPRAKVAHGLKCANPDCNGPHHTYQCPQIRIVLFAPPRCNQCGDPIDWDGPGCCRACREWAEPAVVDVEYAPLGWAA